MSELKPLPCPFCGGAPLSVARPDNIDGTRFFYALACYCGGYSACAHKMAVEPTPEQAKRTAIEAWNRRAQPAQAGHVPEASCGECGKKASDGWALYCVACMEEAGLPAQAVPLLTEDEIAAALPHEPGDLDFVCARAIEQAVRAKMDAAQWQPISTAPKDGTRVMVWMNDKYASNQHAFAKLWFYADGRLGGGAEGYSGDWSISHWMPLPPPPIVGKEGA